MKKIFVAVFFSTLFAAGFSQEKMDNRLFGIKFSGFVKNDFLWDTRQTKAAREGHFLLWPQPEVLDNNGQDINAKSGFNFMALQSRLSGKISGPDAFGAKTSGLLEGDFFAQSDANTHLFRLRHAIIKFKWENTELITGQYWNPLFVTGCFPGTVSFNTGAPIQPFSRNPQIRITQSIGNFQIMLAGLSQRDYVSVGPAGASSTYIRNSSIPDFHGQIHFTTKNDGSGTEIVAGAGFQTKTIVPRLSSTVGTETFKVDEKVTSTSLMGFMKVKLQPVTFKAHAVLGQNLSDVLSITGFAVKEITDPVTEEQSYTPVKSMILWGEIHTNGEKWQVGIFGGLNNNLGTKDAIAGNEVYGLVTNIKSLYRISPRIIFNSGKARFAVEGEYTSALFGETDTNGMPILDADGIPMNTTKVSNMRLLLAAYYFF